MVRTIYPGINPYLDEKIRSKLVRFFENIGIGFEEDFGAEINRLEVKIIKDLKVVPGDSWNKIKQSLNLKFIGKIKIQGSLELLLKSGDYNPLKQQIHPLNHKSNDKHGKPTPIKNTLKKKL